MQLFDVPIDEIDLSATEFWNAPRDYRESAFAKLRNEDPFRFFEEMELAIAPKGPGYIALTRHDDIWHVSRNPQLFCSGKGSNIIDLSQELNEFFACDRLFLKVLLRAKYRASKST